MPLLALCLHALSLLVGGVPCQEAPAQPAPQILAEPAELEYNLELPLTFVGAAAEGQAVVRFDEQDSGDGLELQATRSELALIQVAGGVATPLAGPTPLRPDESGSATVTLRRRQDRVSVLIGPKCVLTAWREATSGKLSLSATEGLLNPDAVYYQPYAPPEFTDNFMRGEEDPTGEWQVVEGTWDNTALIDSLDFAPRAANSFAFAAHAAPRAVAVTGPAFWDDLRCAVAIRLLESGGAGLGFRVQDAANYYAFTVAFGAPEASGQALLKLSRVVAGEERVLASATRNLPIGQWCRLSVAAAEDRFDASVDDVPVLTARDEAFGQGALALVAVDCPTAYFDDAAVEPYRGFTDDFEREDLGRWRTIAGEWKIDPSKEGRRLATASKEAGVVVSGRDDWADHELRAQVLVGKGPAGLCVNWKSPSDYLLWRATRGVQELVRVTEAGEELLDSAPLDSSVKGWVTAELSCRDDYVAARVNGGEPLEALVPIGQSGRVGLWMERGSRAAFDDVAVRFPPGYVPAGLPETMVVDAEMKEQFANPAEGWFNITDEAHRPQAVGMNWNKGEYFDPVDMRFPVAIASTEAGKVTVRIEGDQTTGEGGYQLTLVKPESARTLALELSRAGQALAQAEHTVGDTDVCQVRFGKRGTFIVVYLDGQLAVSYRDRPGAAAPPAPETTETPDSSS